MPPVQGQNVCPCTRGPSASDIIFPFTLSRRRGEAARRIRGARGELFLTLQEWFCRNRPFAQDTRFSMQGLHDGGDV